MKVHGMEYLETVGTSVNGFVLIMSVTDGYINLLKSTGYIMHQPV
jgi:hypothetical protein